MTSTFRVHDVQRPGRPIESMIRVVDAEGALRSLRKHPGARLLAGGTDLLLEFERDQSSAPVTVVDVSSIDGFKSITDEGDRWRLSGGVTHNQVVRHDALRATALPLAQACLEIGSPQLRNRATLAGNLVTASPANDSISALMALDAQVEIATLINNEVEFTTVPVRDFFTGFRQTVLNPGDLVSAIVVPKLTKTQRGLWVKLGLRKAQAISVVHAGLVVEFDEGAVTSASLAMGSVAPTVVMVDEIEAIVGSELDDATIAVAANAIAASISPISDGRATAEYRRTSVGAVMTRALQALRDDEQASMWPDAPPTLSTDDELLGVSLPATTFTQESPVSITVNGNKTGARSSPTTSPLANLLDWVRDEAGLTGMKEGCAEGECGACTMLLDGAAVMSCLVTAAQASGRSVETVEALDHPLQQAFIDDFAVQCGFCIPGFLVSGARLIDECPAPTHAQIALGLSGNLCRCTGYYPIVQAVHDAAAQVRGQRE